MTPDEIDLHVLAGAAAPLLLAARDARGIARRRYLLDAAERALRLADPGAIDEPARAVAADLGLEGALGKSPAPPPPHAVRVPFVSRGLGFVRTLFVTFRPWARPLELPADGDAAASVTGALALAAEKAAHTAEGHVLTAAQPDAFRAARVEGTSLGAAAFVSAFSLWTRRPVRPGVVVTGALDGEAIRSVGQLAAKLEGVQRTPLRVTTFLVPAHDREALPRAVEGVEIVGVADVETLVAQALEDAPAPAPNHDELVHDALKRFRGGWRGWRWAGLRAELEALLGDLPGRRPDLLVQVHAMLAAVVRHLGDPKESLEVLERARLIAESDEGREAVPDAPLALFERQRAMSLRQLGASEPAGEAAERAVAVAKRGRLRGELIPSHGTAGLVASSRGDLREAIAHHRAALSTALRHTPPSAPRSSTYLIAALGQAGDLEGARAAYEDGRAQIATHSRPSARASREAWLRAAFAEALRAHGEVSECLDTLDDPSVRAAIDRHPLPGLLARRTLGLARVARGDVDAGLALLAGSPAAYGHLAAGHTAFVAQQNVLHEARARLRLGALGEDARARLRFALAALPPYEAAARWLQPKAAAVLGALDDVGEPGGPDAEAALAVALDALLGACERLG